MRRIRLHPLIALLCALFLLGAQQAAYAHFLGHLGFAQQTAMLAGNDADHGAASTLSHVCTTCAAFAALDAAPPIHAAALPVERLDAGRRAAAARACAPAPAAPPYSSRAPPVGL